MSQSTALQISKLQVGFFGVGVMGEALMASIIHAGITPGQINFCEKRDERAIEIVERYSARRSSLEESATTSNLIFLVVKPQDLGELILSLAPYLPADSLLVSFAAGKSTHFIEARLTNDQAVVRVMPNTPVLIGKGMSVLSAGAHASADHLALISTLLSTSGAVMYIDESLQDAVTAVSGSGPAYFFAFIEAMVAGGVALGLSAEVATELSIQTIIGAAAMLAESGKSATTLRENVTSPNGTTAAALTRFSQGHLAELVAGAMTAARDRSQELA
jgi:pyrroline-5-carboxylate reductase